MSTEKQPLAIIGEALYDFAQKLDGIFKEAYNSATRATAIALAEDVVHRIKEEATLSGAEEYGFHSRMLNLIADYPELKKVDQTPILRLMEDEVMRHFRAFKENKPEAREEALRYQLAVYRYLTIAESQLFPYQQLKVWWDRIEALVFRKTDSLFPKSFYEEKPTSAAHDVLPVGSRPRLSLRDEPEVKTVEDLIHVLGMMVISDSKPYEALFSNQLIRFRLTNGQPALGLLGEADYFVIHHTNGHWEIIDGVIHDYNDEYKSLPDRLLNILLRYALIGLVPKDLLEHIREGRQTQNLEKKLKLQLEQHESILNLIS